MLVVARTKGESGRAARLRPSERSLTQIALAHEPRRIAWSPSISALFYVATDTTLNVVSGGTERGIDPDHHFGRRRKPPAEGLRAGAELESGVKNRAIEWFLGGGQATAPHCPRLRGTAHRCE